MTTFVRNRDIPEKNHYMIFFAISPTPNLNSEKCKRFAEDIKINTSVHLMSFYFSQIKSLLLKCFNMFDKYI